MQYRTSALIQPGTLRGAILLAMLLAALLVLSLATLQTVQAWDTADPDQLPTGHSDVTFPVVAVDTTGRVHVVWLHSGNGDFQRGAVRYVRGELNSSRTRVSWGSIQNLSAQGGGEGHRSNAPKIATGSDGVIHVAYANVDGQAIYLRNESLGRSGSWDVTVTANGVQGSDNYGLSLALDDANSPYLSWGSGFGDGFQASIQMQYRLSSGSWSGRRTISKPMHLARNTHMVVTGAGDSAVVHVLAETVRANNDEFSIGYFSGPRKAGPYADVELSNELRRGRSTDPALTIDRATGTLLATFVTGSNRAGYKTNIAIGTRGGDSWKIGGTSRISSQVWAGPSSLDYTKGLLHMVTEQKVTSGGSIERHEIHHQAYAVSSDDFSNFTELSSPGDRLSRGPAMDIGNGTLAVWVVNNTGSIKYNVDRLQATDGEAPDPPAGTLNLVSDLGEESTMSLTVQAQISVDTGDADEYRLSNDGDPTGDYLALPAPDEGSTTSNIEWELSTATEEGTACEERTVTAQLRNQLFGLESEPFEDSIMYDLGVDASLEVLNPGVGATGYTSNEEFYARVTALAGECSGLATVTSGGRDASTISATSAEGVFPLADIASDQSLRQVEVQVTDAAGHQRTLSGEIMVDTLPPQAEGSITATLDVVNETGDVLSNTNSILVDLSFQGITITDNLYGRSGEGQNFWGIEVTNITNPISDTSTITDALAGQNWYPLEVTNITRDPDSAMVSFTIDNWSLLRASTAQSGDTVQVAARIIDGAGNHSQAVFLSEALTISPDTPFPIIWLPFMQR